MKRRQFLNALAVGGGAFTLLSMTGCNDHEITLDQYLVDRSDGLIKLETRMGRTTENQIVEGVVLSFAEGEDVLPDPTARRGALVYVNGMLVQTSLDQFVMPRGGSNHVHIKLTDII